MPAKKEKDDTAVTMQIDHFLFGRRALICCDDARALNELLTRLDLVWSGPELSGGPQEVLSANRVGY